MDTEDNRMRVSSHDSNNANSRERQNAIKSTLAGQEVESNCFSLPLYGFKVIETSSEVANEKLHSKKSYSNRRGLTPRDNNSEGDMDSSQSQAGLLAKVLSAPKRVIKAIFSGDIWFSH